MSALTDILARFENPKPSGGQFLVRCSAHEDRSPSLAIREAPDGSVLLKCHAGCSVESILSSLHLEPAALFPPSNGNGSHAPKRDIVATYDYTDEEGKLLFQAVRYSPKGFSQRAPDGAGGWKFSLSGVRRVLYKLPLLKGHPAILLCYSPDTEVLTPTGWVSFPDLEYGSEVAQYNGSTGAITFVHPTAYQRFLNDDPLIQIKADWVDLLVTPDHRMFSKCQRGNWRIRPASELPRGAYLPVSGRFDGQSGKSPTDDQARLLAAYLGDGRLERGRRRSWNAKKPRKVHRLHALLSALSIPFRAAPIQSAPGWIQTVIWSDDAPWLETFTPSRKLSWDAINWSFDARRAFLNELRYWDGDSVGKKGVRFFTAKHHEAEIVSAMAVLSEMGAMVRTDIRESRQDQGPQYVVSLNDRTARTMAGGPSPVQNLFGEVYCVTVPSGLIVVRRNGKAVIAGNCEGEKDVEAALNIGVPATCNPMGAGKWIEDYTEQLVAIGVNRVAIVPDNDEPGRAHAAHVARSCHKAGLAVRIASLLDVPDKGDLSDYLAKHSKAELLALVRESPLWSPVELPDVSVDKEFKVLGEARYGLTVHSAGVTFEIDRLRRDREGLTGELAVSVNGLFPLAKHHHGVISIGDFNLASVQARSTRAKLLTERSGDKDTDWFGLLEEFVTDVMAMERRGQPAVVLADALPEDDETSDIWDLGGFPVLQELPMVLFGDSSSGKSYFAMWLAGMLALRQVPVLYADWEFSQKEHRRRLERLFQPMPKLLHYVRCESPLVRDADRLARMVREYACRYVVCDSIGFAVDGAAETHDAARGYFRGLRQLGVGSLSIAHIPAQTEEGKDPKIFGSTFFKAGARSAWYIDRAQENPPGEIRFGLHHRKTNVGELLASRAYKLVFSRTRTTIEPIDLETVDELSVQLPMIQRVRKALSEADAPMSVKKLAEELASTPNIIRAVISKHKSSFLKVGERVQLAGPKPGEMEF